MKTQNNTSSFPSSALEMIEQSKLSAVKQSFLPRWFHKLVAVFMCSMIAIYSMPESWKNIVEPINFVIVCFIIFTLFRHSRKHGVKPRHWMAHSSTVWVELLFIIGFIASLVFAISLKILYGLTYAPLILGLVIIPIYLLYVKWIEKKQLSAWASASE